MTWLKATWSAISVALLGALAIFAVANARQQRQVAEKWQNKSVDIESGKLKSATVTAEAASTKAKLHEARAAEKKAKAVQRIDQIGEKDEDIADILSHWGT